MPPEPLPWDRKDSFFKERKHHERSSEQQHHHHLGGGIGGGPSRWREPLHPCHYASSSSPRWAASLDFRNRPPHGYGKQGGRHLYPEENGHGFMSLRPNDKSLDDESCRASGSGKYSRNKGESRSSFGLKDWKGGHSREATSLPNGPGRPNGASDPCRSVDDMHTGNSSNPHSDSANSWDQPQSKDQNEKNGCVNATASSRPRFERENSLGTLKPLNKWTRSGSLSSRGSGFSHSSSSKSMGADSNEAKVEVQPSNVTLVHSPSAAAAATSAPPAASCEVYAAPSEETNSRKKPRLGWGEGLAKYEKKKVVGIDDSATTKNGMVICSSNREHVNLLSSSRADKSPRVTGFSDCASPATPSSVGCSSSPGTEEKQFVKAGNVDHDTNNSIVSPDIVSQNHMEGSSFNLENLDLAPNTSLNSAINELLQVNYLSSADSGFVKSTTMNKLLVWKGDVLKALETTETEIDKLEGELKLVSAPGSSGLNPAASSSLILDCHLKPADEQDAASDITPGQSPLELVSSGGIDVHKLQNAMEVDHAEAKDEDVDSPGSATSKFVELLSLGKDFSVAQSESNVDCLLKTDIKESENIEVKCSEGSLNEDKGTGVSATFDGSHLVANGLSAHVNDVNLVHDFEDNLCESILASNREIANRVPEVFNKLLPTSQCLFDISSATGASCLENSHLVKERLLKRKSFLRFKERVLSLKFRALHQQWKDDIRSPTIRKFHIKAQKKDVSVRAVNGGHQKPRLSIRRLSPSAGSLSSAPTPKTINFVSKLISDSQVKPFRNTLKMPALILDEREKIASRFISTNGLVEDPRAVETERSMINPWTEEEKELFMDKLAAYGKDFSKIASFLAHKTTADCVEFYYKNHKSDCFRQTIKPPGFAKKGKAQSTNNYLVSAGKRWNRESNAASLDILGAASAIAANVEVAMEIQQKCTSKYLLSSSSNCKRPKGDTGVLERSGSLDGDNTDRETAAADVLAGICGSLSSEAMGSCITSAVDPGEGYHEWKYQKVGPTSRWPLTPEMSQNLDDETCSDESCGEMDPTDWTDDEKSIFVQAVSSYGKDFDMISRCVRTRSRDQCRVFFSKARKCFGLDMICSGSGNTDVARNDPKGAGSDTDDTCVVETALLMCSEKSGIRKEDVTSPDVKLIKEHEVAATIEPDMNKSDANNGAGDLELNDAEHQPSNTSNETPVEEKPTQDLDGDVDMDTGPSSSKSADVQDKCTLVNPSRTEVEENTGEANDHPDRSDTLVNGGAVVEVADHHRAESKGLVQEIPEMGMDVDMDGADPSDASGRDKVIKSKPEAHNSGSHHIAADTGSSGCGGVSGDQQEAELESDSAPKSCAIPPPQNNYSVPMNLLSQVFGAVKCGNSLSEHASPATSIGNTGEGCQPSRPGEQHLSRGSLMGSPESSHILKGYPLSVSSAKEVNGNVSCERSGTHQSNQKLDMNFHADWSSNRDGYLQKCGIVAKLPTSIGELPSLSRHQSTDNVRSSISSDVEKPPHRNGDVKLFGQILTKPSSQQKATFGAQQNGNNENQHLKTGKTFNMKSTGDQSVNANSGQTMLDHNKFLATENLPARSYGYWDGNRIQNGGFPSLPDSAMLLAKYPAAFNNYALPSSRIEQLSLPGVNVGERSFNGPAFPARDIGSSSGADYQMYRNNQVQQPFTLDVKQRHDLLLSEMQRRNGFDVVSSMQQQARGMVGMNVVGRGDIIVGGLCTGVSDPVAAIKMHYAQAEQFNGQASNITREDDSWRDKGNVGR